MAAFWIALLYVFLAEMGDKTQLVALAFAARLPARTVLAGVFFATLLVHLFSVALGEAAGLAIPALWINVTAGLAFIGFGVWTLRGDTLDEEKEQHPRTWGPLLTVAVTFFLAELGDKTMLATVTIASRERAFVPVWLGSTLGMVVADGLAIFAGHVAGVKLPETLIKHVAVAIFIASGLFLLGSAFTARIH